MKWYHFGVIAMLCFALAFVSAQAATVNTNSQSMVIVNATTSEVVAGKNIDTVRPIASITKLMTAIVVIETKLPMDEKITITKDDVQTASLRRQTFGASLPIGTVITRENLLLLTLMNSHNRAAAALGRNYPGGLPMFVQLMNMTADRIGMKSSHFAEPTGLSANNTSTAHDLALLVQYASQYEEIQRLSTSSKAITSYEYRDKIRDVQFGTTNRLLVTPSWDIDLQKTGYTGAAGRCIVMLTNVKDSPFIVVLLNSSSTIDRAADAIRIRGWLETGSVPTARQVRALNPYKTKSRVKSKHKRHKRR